MRLKGKSAIVTGGGSGIGRAITLAFIQEGARVAILDKAPEAIENELEGSSSLLVLKADVTDTEAVESAVNRAAREFSKIDILINNAGYTDGKTLETQTEEEWDAIFNVNVNGYARCLRAALPYLKESCGNILNTASYVGLHGMRNGFGYSASKGAVIGMTKSLALDLAQYGIRANAICPGWILTDLIKNRWSKRQQNTNALEELIAAHPLGRMGTPEDCAKAALYLCSDEAAFVTGETLIIDGGLGLGYGPHL